MQALNPASLTQRPGRVLALLIVLALLVSSASAQSEPAARVETTTRLVTAQQPNGTIRPLAANSALEVGETIVTGRDSSAKLIFADGSELTLRPDSRLRIENFSFQRDAPKSDNVLLRLLKGGLRTVTGLIGKRGNRDAYKLGVVAATVGIRGTDFMARICEEDCAREEARLRRSGYHAVPPPAARMAFLTGAITATGADGVTREIAQGSAIYQGDVVKTAADAWGMLVFRDEGRMTLAGNTVFAVEQFRYEKMRPERNTAVLRFFQGGLRAVSGLIAKRRAQAYRVDTLVATIGVRGTTWDATCSGSCVSAPGDPHGAPQAGKMVEPLNRGDNAAGGLTVNTTSGTVLVSNKAGTTEVIEGATLVVSSLNVKPTLLQGRQPPLFDQKIPQPEKLDINMEDLFGVTFGTPGPGVFVYVLRGEIALTVDGKSVIVGQGVSGFTDMTGSAPVRVDEVPLFLEQDAWCGF